MKLIIAGSRTVMKYSVVDTVVSQALAEWAGTGVIVEEVVSGTARGADLLGEEWARRHGIRIKRFPANWNAHGRAAGIIRNREMAEYADALVTVWDGSSPGTKNMIAEMRRRGKLVHVHVLEKASA